MAAKTVSIPTLVSLGWPIMAPYLTPLVPIPGPFSLVVAADG